MGGSYNENNWTQLDHTSRERHGKRCRDDIQDDIKAIRLQNRDKSVKTKINGRLYQQRLDHMNIYGQKGERGVIYLKK